MSEIVILKTVIGEEVIATKEGDTYSRARTFRMMPDGQGGAKAGLIPFLMVAPDAAFTINQSLIMTELPAPSDITTAYLEATSGLTLARG